MSFKIVSQNYNEQYVYSITLFQSNKNFLIEYIMDSQYECCKTNP